MFVTLQITSSQTQSIWDAVDKVRIDPSQGDNAFPKLGNFCRYLSLQRIQAGGGASSAILISGISRIHASSVPFFTGLRLDSSNPLFVLQDMQKGKIPLQDIYIAEDGGVNAINVIIITDDSEDK